MNKIKLFISHLIIEFSKYSYIKFTVNEKIKTLFVMGMFRTGTSLTCQILEANKLYLGPKWRLLQGKGRLKKLNPNGFFEDFLYANLARYWVHILGKTGANPPSYNEVKKIELKPIKISDFIRFAEFISPDDRISFVNRHRAYLLLLLKKEKAFYAPKQDLVKIPMLLLFHEQILQWLPKIRFLLVIRNPESTINSSKKLTAEASISLYDHYYEFLEQMYLANKETAAVLSYDNLLKNPESSIKILTEVLNIDFHKESLKLIDPNLIRNTSNDLIESRPYQYLYNQIINKI